MTATCGGGGGCGRARCCYCGAREREREGGGGRGAHGESVEADGELGEALWTTNRAAASGGRGRGRRVAASSWGPPALRGSAERCSGSRRSSWAGQRSEGEAVATVVLVGGDEPVRVAAREGERRRGKRH